MSAPSHWPVRENLHEFSCTCDGPLELHYRYTRQEWVAHVQATERARIVEDLAAIHAPEVVLDVSIDVAAVLCAGCLRPVDADGDCPTMRIAKGKP